MKLDYLQSLDKLFRDTVKDDLKLYWKTRKFKIPMNSGIRMNLVEVDSRMKNPILVEEVANWENFAQEDAIEDLVLKLAREAAFSVEFLIRRTVGPTSFIHSAVQNLYVADIFTMADSSENLHLNIVKNAPVSVIDPAGIVPGWVSYRFHWACGYPTKSEDEYTFSPESEQVTTEYLVTTTE